MAITMEVKDLLELMDNYYERMKNCVSTAGKKNNGEYMINLLHENPILSEYWSYLPNKRYWDNRFKKDRKIISYPPTNEGTTCGLYLVGSTYFNPFTREEYYWIKVGLSVDIQKRMKQYATHNPMLWKQSFLPLGADKINYVETLCHNDLNEKAYKIAENTNEWYLVSREVYLDICEKEWDWFPSLKDLVLD